MDRIKTFALKNALLAVTLFVNFLGQVLVAFYFDNNPQVIKMYPHLMKAADSVGRYFQPITTIVFYAVQIFYERPVRAWLNLKYAGARLPEELDLTARRRLLNEIFFLMGLNLVAWILGGLVYTITFLILYAPQDMVFRTIYISLFSGMLVVFLTFYCTDFVVQRWLVPVFFPNGGLHKIPGVIRVRARMRMVAMVWAINLIPMLAILLLPKRVLYLFPDDPAAAFDHLQISLTYHSIFFMCLAGLLIFIMAKSFLRPILEIIQVIRGVNQGDLSGRVKVTSNDEIGFTGDVLNEMTNGLREKERLQKSMDLAMEVQQHLLPKQPPIVPGLDIAGRSVYCDETGGDYYDYVPRIVGGHRRLAVVVGDVAGHGMPSALLMATARAFIRRSYSDPLPVNSVLSDVSSHLAQAVEDSGQFMTLFIMEMDSHSKSVSWSNAGHEPALVYNSSSRTFSELGGRGTALAVTENYPYELSRKKMMPGEIYLLGTDGIWEAAAPDGVMFGRRGLKDVVRAHSWMSAQEIVGKVIEGVRQFTHPLPFRDDVTLVVIKVLE